MINKIRKHIVTYPSVNRTINILLNNVSGILDNQFIGMYLHGSLALNDFVPERSDVDIVVVTKEVIPENKLEKLKSMHHKITSSNLPYVKRMECTYIPIESLRNYEQEKAYFPCLHVGGDFYTDGFGIIEKHVLREKGKVINGPDPKSFIKPVSSDKLKSAALESLKNWWLPKLKDHLKLKEDDYQVYAILTMCRILYTAKFGKVVSKSVAAQYVTSTMNKKWTKLIHEALLWKIGNKFTHLEETLNFIKYTNEIVK